MEDVDDKVILYTKLTPLRVTGSNNCFILLSVQAQRECHVVLFPRK